MVDSIDVLAKMRGMKGVVIQDNIHDDKTIGKLSQIDKCMYAMYVLCKIF